MFCKVEIYTYVWVSDLEKMCTITGDSGQYKYLTGEGKDAMGARVREGYVNAMVRLTLGKNKNYGKNMFY